MPPFAILGPKVSQLDQGSYTRQKDRIVSATGAHIVLLSLIGEQSHFEILFRLRPVIMPIHAVLVASGECCVKIRLHRSCRNAFRRVSFCAWGRTGTSTIG